MLQVFVPYVVGAIAVATKEFANNCKFINNMYFYIPEWFSIKKKQKEKKFAVLVVVCKMLVTVIVIWKTKVPDKDILFL